MTNPHLSHIPHEPALCQSLRREYLQGATYKALAEKYQIDQRTAKRLCSILQETDGRKCKRTWKLACGFAKDEWARGEVYQVRGRCIGGRDDERVLCIIDRGIPLTDMCLFLTMTDTKRSTATSGWPRFIVLAVYF